jgi:Glycosyl hydrolase family 3 N terminal domain
MNLDGKIGQMSQSTAMATPISDAIKQEIRQGRWGSFLNAGSPPDRAEAQRIARKESHLGIPLIFGRDVTHGYRTIFPTPRRLRRLSRIFHCEMSEMGLPTMRPPKAGTREPIQRMICQSPRTQRCLRLM